MNLSRQGSKKWNYTALAFAIPFAGMLMVMLISRYKPFGSYSMLYSDMYHQYYPFFVAYRDALRSGKSLLYSWNVGLGMDYLGLISYYLASPLNLLSVLVPKGWLLEYFSLLVPVKLGLAGMFFAVFLKKIFRKDDISISVFGAFYGLCAWALGYQWNVMWLDTFALLSLVTLGLVALIEEKKFFLYTVTLFLSVFSNYYIGFFTCIFVLLVFLCYEFCNRKSGKAFFSDLCRVALFSILAIGMTAILELPALAALGTTQSGVNKFPHGLKLNIAGENTIWGLLDAMRRVAGNMGGGLEPTFKEGLPNLYCGVGTILLAMLYLLAGEVRLRDKLCAVGLLLFFNLSFVVRQLDYIWHGFHFTNMIPYRFSFLYSFVMLYMAYRAWLLRRKFQPLQLLTAGFLTAAILCCSDSLMERQDWNLFGWEIGVPVYLIYNAAFLLLYLGILWYAQAKTKIPQDASELEARYLRTRQNRRRYAARMTALFVMGTELVCTLLAFGLYFPGTGVSNYPKGTESAASMIRYMHEREARTLFYRAETTHSQTLNDGALNGYNGISTFTSSANVKTTEFMRALGYGAKNTYNRYCFEESSPVANLFLGLKYMLERDGKDKQSEFFTDVHHFKDVHLLENNAFLPLGFLANSELSEVDFTQGGVFQMQNVLFSAATGVEGDVWHKMTGDSLHINPDGVTLTESRNTGYCAYEEAFSGASVTYSYVADRSGFMCVHLNLPKRNDFYVSRNGENLYKETISLPQMLAVGDVKAGDTVEVQVMLEPGEKSTMTIGAGIVDSKRFWQGYEVLSAGAMGLTEFRNTRAAGIVDCDRDGLLYTSIPQNGNWTAAVDGEPTEITLIGDCMIGVPLTKGVHEVEFVYRNAAFSLGWKVSLGCALLFGGLTFVYYRPTLKLTAGKKGKFERR